MSEIEIIDITEDTTVDDENLFISIEDAENQSWQPQCKSWQPRCSQNDPFFFELTPSFIVKTDATLLQEIDELKGENHVKINIQNTNQSDDSDVLICESDASVDQQINTSALQSRDTNEEYNCKICGKKFSRKSALKSHEHLHDLDKESSHSEIEENNVKISGNDSDISAGNQQKGKRTGIRKKRKKRFSNRKTHNVRVRVDTNNKRTVSKQGQNSIQLKVDDKSEQSTTNHSNVKNPESLNVVNRNTDKTKKVKVDDKNEQCTSNNNNVKNSTSLNTGNRYTTKTKKIRNCKCHICGITVRNKTNLSRHMHVIHKVKPSVMPTDNIGLGIKCYVCGQRLTSRGHLVRHIETIHLKKKKNISRLSTRKSESRTSIPNNKRMSKYICHVCGLSFNATLYNFQFHLNWHDKDKSAYNCDICEKSFLHKSSLTSHTATSHPDSFFFF